MDFKRLKDIFKIGNEYFFEYHCLESHDSSDAELWYKSHQKVTILEILEPDFTPSKTFKERMEEGLPLTYLVRFNDGFTYHAMEDELMETEEHFSRPCPPLIPK